MKIGIVGCGQVGSSIAYACVLRGIGTELVLVDHNPILAMAHAEDILHATPFSKPMPISSGSYDALKNCHIVMISAGVPQEPGETRLDLLKRNLDVFSIIIPRILDTAPNAILLIATNPVDIMTHVAATIARDHGHTPGRVIGSGTMLDTARFRTLIAQYLGVSSHSVHSHVLGEHGDSEVLHWSGASISNINIVNFSEQIGRPITPHIKASIDEGVRRAAYRIIEGKGATWFGIGAAMARLAQAIIEDEHCVLTCSVPLAEVEGIQDITLSLPHIVSSRGVEKTIWPALSEDEHIMLHRSASVIKQSLGSLI